jgi:rRNA small subunit pseudouridine methyltransferase Nep1
LVALTQNLNDNTKPITFLVVESAIELIPEEIIHHPVIVKHAKRRGKKPSECLLDDSIHFRATRNLKDNKRRGRPDIIHLCLLEAIGSPLMVENKLEVAVHTYQDQLLLFSKNVRIPRNYSRFCGLMEQLLVKGKVPPESENPLIKVEKNMPVKDFVERVKPTSIIGFTRKGELKRPSEIAKEVLKEKHPLLIVGGFPHGSFKQETIKVMDKTISIYPKPLEAHIVISRILGAYEELILFTTPKNQKNPKPSRKLLNATL